MNICRIFRLLSRYFPLITDRAAAVAKVGRVHPLKDVNLKNVLQSYSCQDISVRTSRQLRFPRLPKSHNELLSEILALEVDVFNNFQQTIGAH